MNDNKLRSTFFGLSKAFVGKMVQQLQREEAVKKEQTEQELYRLSEENKLLSDELLRLNREIESAVKDKVLMDYCLQKSDNYCALFELEADMEIAEVSAIGQKIETLFDVKINEFEQSIDETQTILEALLKDIAYKNENIEERLIQFMSQEGAYKFLSKKQEKHAEKAEDSSIIQPSILKEEDEHLAESNKSVQEGIKSQAISKEIINIRNKYLIGKIAGADLIDADGNLIITRNQKITMEAVEKADKSGKLAELIVNMTLPEIVK